MVPHRLAVGLEGDVACRAGREPEVLAVGLDLRQALSLNHERHRGDEQSAPRITLHDDGSNTTS